MKLVHPDLDSVMEFGEERVCTLVIEDQAFFRSFLQDLNEQINGMEGKSVLSVGDRPVSFASNAELIDSWLNFSLNRKTMINKVIGALEQKAVCEAYLQTAELLGGVERLVMELSESFPCDLVCKKLTIGNVFRGIGVELAEEGADPLEKLLDYMELVREFDREKLFFLVNLRSWYPDETIELFLQSVLGHGYKVLLIDSRDCQRLPSERRVTIDSDLCEF
ncbi:MAG: type II-A CRISPR-associated protein Csn2 [Oscillospiraceae bacterium]|nr:type II-A CRISPR-associated protein Csn2 [Oscillospiraceae bacterium]